jgi:hypothetical protein
MLPGVVDIHLHGQACLAQVIDALDELRALLGAAEGRQHHRREDADDRDDDQQLDQGKTEPRPPGANFGRALDTRNHDAKVPPVFTPVK